MIIDQLQHDLQGLLLLVFALGLRHGFDPDHLATIEGIARLNTGTKLARWTGILFSLGHGAVVVLIAWVVGAIATSWQVPDWVDLLGALISIVFLTFIGVINLLTVLKASPGQIVQTVGLKGRFIGRLNSATSPLGVGFVGALFALSFDTMSQAALFAVAGTQHGGVDLSLTLGLLFMTGMLITDGLHGVWVARMMKRAGEFAAIASQVMGFAVASLSLLVALYGVLKLLSPTVEAFGEGREVMFAIGILAVTGLSFVAAIRITRSRV